MSERGEGGKRYDDRQIGAILRRAAELQTRQGSGPNRPPPGHGISLEELERAAGDVGIDPRHVRAAATELEQQGTDPASAAVGELERTIEGEITEEAWEEMVAELRRTYGHPGACGKLGHTYEWTWKYDGGSITVTARPKNGKTRIQILSRRDETILLAKIFTWLGGFFLCLISILPLTKSGIMPPWGIIPLAAVILGSLNLATNRGLASWLARTNRERRVLMDRLVALAEESAMVEDSASLPVQRPVEDEEAIPQRVLRS